MYTLVYTLALELYDMDHGMDCDIDHVTYPFQTCELCGEELYGMPRYTREYTYFCSAQCAERYERKNRYSTKTLYGDQSDPLNSAMFVKLSKVI